MQIRQGKVLLLVSLMLLVAIAFGCARAGDRGPGGALRPQTPKPPAGTEDEIPLAVYFLKSTSEEIYLVREVHSVPRTKEVAAAALNELIQGTPKTEGAFRVIPKNTRILGIAIEDGLATVDFSQEVLRANVGAAGEALGIQSIVNTLTEFPTIKKVAFKVEGKRDEAAMQWWGHVGLYGQPFSRDLSRVYEPAIWVYRPQPGQRVESPLIITGSARVFEATVETRLLDRYNRFIAGACGTATAGAPERGDFEITMEFKPPETDKGYLEVFWSSPKDGRPLDVVRIPVTFD